MLCVAYAPPSKMLPLVLEVINLFQEILGGPKMKLVLLKMNFYLYTFFE